MPSRALLDGLIQAERVVEGGLASDLRGFWSSLDMSNPVAVREQMVEVVPPVVDEYGQIMATLAADYFEDAVSATPVIPLVDYAVLVARSMAWAVQPLFAEPSSPVGGMDQPTPRRPDPSSALSRALSSANRHARQQGRDVIDESVRGTPGVVYARVPTGAETCAFCMVLASRGFTYGSERSAGGEGNHFHDDCDCRLVPSYADDAQLTGYDPDELYELYANAHSPGDSIKDVTANMRRMYDVR